MQRRKTRQINVRGVAVGGDSPISVQTMTTAAPDDVEGAIEQIKRAADLGCDIIRCAVPAVNCVDAFKAVVAGSPLPVVADIHFDWRIALGAVEAGADKIRINPGNMGDWDGIGKVVKAARERGIPIRIGVNSGSVKHKSGEGDTRSIPEALAEEAVSYAERFEEMGFGDIVLSVKSADVVETIQANREIAAKCDYPLHLGVTAAGPEDEAILKSAVGVGSLLADGIGDTIRLSFTGEPDNEVVAGKKLLRSIGLLQDRPVIISCPTCGRCKANLPEIVEKVRDELAGVKSPVKVAVMGCEVNGPGEARGADVGLAASPAGLALFLNGKVVDKFPPEQAIARLVEEVMCLAQSKE